MRDHLDHDTSIDPRDLASLNLIRITPMERTLWSSSLYLPDLSPFQFL